MDRTLDPKEQTGPSSVPDTHPSPEDDPFNITDAQGVSHRGSVVVRACWTPELGCLDEVSGEDFRIVFLREPLAQGAPTPECGVAFCAPDVATRPTARARETAVAYRTRPAEGHSGGKEPELALAPEHAAAEVVRRTFHNAFAATQEALPPDSTALAEEAQAQLAPGAPEAE